MSTLSLLLAASCLAAGPDGARPGLEGKHPETLARVRQSVVTLVARSSAAEALDRLGRELGPRVRVHLAAAVRSAGQQRVASGIVIDGEGHIATSASFAIHGGPFLARGPGGVERAAELVGVDLATDVALFRSAAPGLVPAVFADPDSAPKRGATLCVVGSLADDRCAHAEGRLDTAKLNPGAGRMHDYLALDVSAPSGSAGAAVVDEHGRVVGMVSALRQGGGTLAVPAATVRQVAALLCSEGAIRRGWLGVNVVSSAGAGGEEAGIPVAGVVAGSPAEIAGLAAGDRILSYAGRKLIGVADFVRLVAEGKPGDEVEIRYLRGRHEASTISTLAERPTPERVGGIRVRLAPDDRAWLGVNTQPLTLAHRTQSGVEAESGVLLSEVVTDSPAARAGLRPGDIVLAVGGQRIAGSDAFSDAVRRNRPGDGVTLEILRNGARQTVAATLGRRPAEAWLGQIPQFQLAFDSAQWRQLGEALERLPEDRRERGYEDVRTLLEAASPSAVSRQQMEELRREMERLARQER